MLNSVEEKLVCFYLNKLKERDTENGIVVFPESVSEFYKEEITKKCLVFKNKAHLFNPECTLLLEDLVDYLVYTLNNNSNGYTFKFDCPTDEYLKYYMSDEQWDKLKIWGANQEFNGPEPFMFSLSYTGIGSVIKVKYRDLEIDLSDYENW